MSFKALRDLASITFWSGLALLSPLPASFQPCWSSYYSSNTAADYYCRAATRADVSECNTLLNICMANFHPLLNLPLLPLLSIIRSPHSVKPFSFSKACITFWYTEGTYCVPVHCLHPDCCWMVSSTKAEFFIFFARVRHTHLKQCLAQSGCSKNWIRKWINLIFSCDTPQG